MWSTDDIEIEVEACEGSTMIVAVTTPLGIVRLVGDFTLVGDTLRVDRAHMDGPGAGSLGRSGLNAIGRKFLEEAGVEEIVIQGGFRTTGRNTRRRPRPFRFPNRKRDP